MIDSRLCPSPLSFWAIEDKAPEIGRDNGFDYESISLREFVGNIGGRIVILDETDAKTSEGGLLRVYGNRQFEIHLSPLTSVLRDNFTIAHELGHLFLHTGEPWGAAAAPDNPITVYRYLPEESAEITAEDRERLERMERQANRFAASLLMPQKPFVGMAIKTGNDLQVLSGIFRVSIPAIEARLDSLGLK